MKIKIDKLNKSFGEQKVLKELSLNIGGFHSLVIIGPSGGGKSTLLRILAGLETSDSGTISINDNSIPKGMKELREYRRSIGMVFQAYNLFPHLSALNNLVLPLTKVHKVHKSEAISRSSELLERFQLGEHIHKNPHQLSGGQQQRVAIARAVALGSQFLLLDEPTSALDPALTSEVLDSIDELRREKKDLILVTHEMGFARNVADYIIFVDEGRVVEEGPAKDLFEAPKTPELQSFLGKTLKY